MNAYSFLTRSSAAHGDAVIIRENAKTFAYADLARESARHAALFASLGLAPGERVAAQLDGSAQSLFLYFGVLRAGLVFVPIPPAAGDAETARIVGDAAPRIIVCAPDGEAAMRGRARGLKDVRVYTLGSSGDTSGTLHAALPASAEFAAAARSEDDLALIHYAPGRPGVMLSHANLTVNAAALATAWGITASDTLLDCLPEAELAVLNAVVLAGASMRIDRRPDVKRLINRLADETVLLGTAHLYEQLLADPALTAEACRPLRLCIANGALLTAATFNAFQLRSDHALVAYYSVAEGGIVTSSPLDGERRAGKVGLRLREHKLRVVGPNLKPMPFDHVGDIVLQGPNVCKGYWNNPGLTAAAIQPDGWFRTSDTGYWDEDGYITLADRD